jgi:hypothetical protein
MAATTPRVDRDAAEKAWNAATGWLALLAAVLGLHAWVATGQFSLWARGGLIFAAALGVWWAFGYWGEVGPRLRAWVRSGGLNTFAVAVLLIVALVIVNTLVRRRLPLKVDLTQNQRFTLAPRSREIVRSLEKPITATVFIPAGRSVSRARDLFKQYGDASPHFVWRRVDPLTDQKTYLEKQPKLGPDLTAAVLEYDGRRQDVTDFTEKSVTSAILKLTRGTPRKLLFLSGHGEPSVSAAAPPDPDPRKRIQALVQDLRSLEWPVEEADLYRENATTPDPAEVAALIIFGPQRELAPVETKRINEFLGKGGKVLLLLADRGPVLTKFLAEWGIKSSNNLVIGAYEGGLLPLAPPPNAHEAVRNIDRVIFTPGRGLSAVSPAPAGITVTELLNSGPESRIVTDFREGSTVDLRNTASGPIGIAMLAEKKTGSDEEAPTARLIVVGSSTWATDQWTSIPTFFNAALASSLVNFLGEEESLVAIPPKDENTEQAFLTPQQGRLLLLVHFLDFPLLALALAVIVYLKRR